MKYIRTRVLCYTKVYSEYAKKLDKLYQEEELDMESAKNMGYTYKKNKQLQEDIEITEGCLEQAQEFKDGFLGLDIPFLSVCQGDEPDKLIVEIGGTRAVINETLESFEAKIKGL
jgi:hypothetical protein